MLIFKNVLISLTFIQLNLFFMLKENKRQTSSTTQPISFRVSNLTIHVFALEDVFALRNQKKKCLSAISRTFFLIFIKRNFRMYDTIGQ